MSSVKTPSLIAILFLVFTSLNAQIKSPVNNAFQADMKKVINDYPNKFRGILGEMIEKKPQTTDYTSTLMVNGAEKCIITQYTSNRADIFSWEGLMLTSEEFEIAEKKFKALYTQLKGLKVEYKQHLPISLIGDYETPAEERKFTSVLFTGKSDTMGDAWKTLRVELTMQYEFPEWKVKVIIYDKEREDDERGDPID